MATVYVTLDDKKFIKNYSNTQQEGMVLVTIDDAKVASLPEYFDKIWVDENNLAHADNLPITKQESELNKIKASIDADKQTIDAKVQQANDAIGKLTITQAKLDDTISTINGKLTEANTANAQFDTKIKALTTLIGQITAEIASAKATTK